jgi:hypothetical protein
MALRIVKDRNDTNSVYQRGIERDEVGIVVRRFQVTYFPEVNERIKDLSMQTFIRVQSQFFSRKIACDGEVRTTTVTGIMAFTLGVACAFANDVITFKDRGTNNQPINPRGTILLDEATETQDRNGWRFVSVRASSDPLL